ncbi:polysaccharide biosynthesis/export family protein [Mucilaginibacter phyllosphaerae]
MITKKWLSKSRIFGLGTLIAGTSCSYRQNQLLFDTHVANGNIQAVSVAPYEYKIQTQDMLQMRNLQDIGYIVNIPAGNNTNNSGTSIPQPQTYQVENDSTVALPVLGKVKVAGLTKPEAALKIQHLYSQSIKYPIIDLRVVNLKVSLFGEVKSPGSYPLISDKTNLIDMLAQAGGLTEKGDEKKIKIIRGGMTNPQVLLFDLNDFRTVSNPAIILQSQDVIYVAQNKRAIKNEKMQDFSTVVQPGLLFLNTALLIFTIARK